MNMNKNDIKKLNWYHLSYALYDAWKEYDTPATKKSGKERIEMIYAEFARRGMDKMAPPKLTVK